MSVDCNLTFCHLLARGSFVMIIEDGAAYQEGEEVRKELLRRASPVFAGRLRATLPSKLDRVVVLWSKCCMMKKPSNSTGGL